jgi:nucleotide-binding universal stress UspA family protein
MKIERLLAATDLSAPANHAVERAAMIARESGAALDLLHVVSFGPLEKLRKLMQNTSTAMQQRIIEATHGRLTTQAETLAKRYGISADVRVLSGALLNELHEASADMVVCGARGEGFMRHMLLGSTAERMLRRTRRPMLVVKQAVHETYKTVLIPVDFSSSSLRAIEQAKTIAPQAEIILLHAYEVPFEGQLRYASVEESTLNEYLLIAKHDATDSMETLCRQAGLALDQARYVLVHGNPSSSVIEQEQVQSADLIVMGKHGENLFEELLLGSVTKHVLAESQCDVLVSV